MLPRFLQRRLSSAGPTVSGAAPGSDWSGPGALPRPVPPVCVIGDLHGRADLLDRMLALVDTQPGAASARVILAGDMIDRGPGSAEVLARVQALVRAGRALALMGNHERMMLDVLDAPAEAGPLWRANGGDATLAGFGLNPWRSGDPAALAAALRRALPPGQEAWLRGLPLLWREGALVVSHAGLDPGRAVEEQVPQVLLWGHRDFRRKPRHDGIWVVHGHVIQPELRAEAGRIGTDTGAFATGLLSAAWLDADGLRRLEVRSD